MAEQLVVIGAGGFGRETIDVVRAVNASVPAPIWDLVGVVDDTPSDANRSRLEALNVAFLGPVKLLANRSDAAVVIGVGSPQARASIADRIENWGLTAPDFVHPTAVVGSHFTTQGGLVACAHASVGTNVTIGRHVHLNPHAVIGHDTQLEDFVSVNPNATVSGDCVIGAGTLVGAGGVVLQGLTVGKAVMIGASACVVKNAVSNSTLIGVPAASRERMSK